MDEAILSQRGLCFCSSADCRIPVSHCHLVLDRWVSVPLSSKYQVSVLLARTLLDAKKGLSRELFVKIMGQMDKEQCLPVSHPVDYFFVSVDSRLDDFWLPIVAELKIQVSLGDGEKDN